MSMEEREVATGGGSGRQHSHQQSANEHHATLARVSQQDGVSSTEFLSESLDSGYGSRCDHANLRSRTDLSLIRRSPRLSSVPYNRSARSRRSAPAVCSSSSSTSGLVSVSQSVLPRGQSPVFQVANQTHDYHHLYYAPPVPGPTVSSGHYSILSSERSNILDFDYRASVLNGGSPVNQTLFPQTSVNASVLSGSEYRFSSSQYPRGNSYHIASVRNLFCGPATEELACGEPAAKHPCYCPPLQGPGLNSSRPIPEQSQRSYRDSAERGPLDDIPHNSSRVANLSCTPSQRDSYLTSATGLPDYLNNEYSTQKIFSRLGSEIPDNDSDPEELALRYNPHRSPATFSSGSSTDSSPAGARNYHSSLQRSAHGSPAKRRIRTSLNAKGSPPSYTALNNCAAGLTSARTTSRVSRWSEHLDAQEVSSPDRLSRTTPPELSCSLRRNLRSDTTGSCASSSRRSTRVAKYPLASPSGSSAAGPGGSRQTTSGSGGMSVQDSSSENSGAATNDYDLSSAGTSDPLNFNARALTSPPSMASASDLEAEESEMWRLQSLLEARGLPPQLFGAFAPRMHSFAQRTGSSSNSNRAHQLLQGLLATGDENQQMQAVSEMCQMLIMGNEDTLAGFPVKQVVPALIALMSMEHNFDVMHNASRALTYMMESLPRSSSVIVDAIPVFLEKLQSIQCMDVAEQSLKALEMLSRRHGRAILNANGVSACLQYLEFFSTDAQRAALVITANCCSSIGPEEFDSIRSSLSLLTSRLTVQDKKSLESVCLCFSRLVENCQHNSDILVEIGNSSLLTNIQQLLSTSPSLITSGTFIMVVHMLSVLCSQCPQLAVHLLNQNIADTLCYLLVGAANGPTEDAELVARSPQELMEIVILISELMPQLPSDGIFAVNTWMCKPNAHHEDTICWQWKDDSGIWHPYSSQDTCMIEAAHQAGEDEVALNAMGRTYVVDFDSMQQVNEDSGTARAVQRRIVSSASSSTPNEMSKSDVRIGMLLSESGVAASFIRSLFSMLYKVYTSSAGPNVRHKCLQALLRMIYYTKADLLKEVLSIQQISSQIAAMLASFDLRVIVGALQLTDILLEKLPDTFHVYFRRQGVMHQVLRLADSNTQIGPSPLATTVPFSSPLSSSVVVSSPVPRRDLSASCSNTSSIPTMAPLIPVATSLVSTPPMHGAGMPLHLGTAGAHALIHPPPHLHPLGPTHPLSVAQAAYAAFGSSGGLLLPAPPPVHLPMAMPLAVQTAVTPPTMALTPSIQPTAHLTVPGVSVPSPHPAVGLSPASSLLAAAAAFGANTADHLGSPLPVHLATPPHHPPNFFSPQLTGVAAAMSSASSSYPTLGGPSHDDDHSAAPGQLRLSDVLKRKRNPKRTTSTSRKARAEEEVSREQLYNSNLTRPTSSSIAKVASPNRSKQFQQTSKACTFLATLNPARWGRNTSNNCLTERSGQRENILVKSSSTSNLAGNKEKIRSWVRDNAVRISKQYFNTDGSSHPALDILNRLTNAITSLERDVRQSLSALQEIRSIINESDISAFEIIHSRLVSKLLRYLTDDDASHYEYVARENRLRNFLHVFLLCPLDYMSREQPEATGTAYPLTLLLTKLNACINQVEQFPVKVHELPDGSHGSSTGTSILKFFSTHQIKCSLQRHPSCSNLRQWKGGFVKIDPLAMVSAIERYLIQRGCGRIKDDDDKSTDDENSDEDIDDNMAAVMATQGGNRHRLQILIGDKVLPYTMTVYQAIRQYGYGQGVTTGENSDIDSEIENPLTNTSMWLQTHTVWYRPVPEDITTASTPSRPSQTSKANSGRRGKSCPNAKSSTRRKGGDELWLDGTVPESLSPLAPALNSTLSASVTIQDSSLEIICLLRIMHALNNHWGVLYKTPTYKPVISNSEFVNSKLTAKANRQLMDPLVIMTGSLPLWLSQLPLACPFLFPFETRQMLLYALAFDRDRAMQRLLDMVPEVGSHSDGSEQRVTPRLDRRKRLISRNDILKQAEAVIQDMGSSRALLEIQYEDEVGSGLGPTLEFYALVSKEFQRADNEMWRGDVVKETDGTNIGQEYVHSTCGLYPIPLGRNTKLGQLNRVKSKFKFLGKFMAKALMDSRLLDIPISVTFYKWLLSQENQFVASDLLNVDATYAKSLYQMESLVWQKASLLQHQISYHSMNPASLKQSLEALTLDGCSIEDLSLDFTLPGHSHIELKRGGKDTPVSIHNLDTYVKLVLHWTLIEGVSRQMDAFKEGFESVCSLTHLQLFYPEEMEMLFCGNASESWDVRYLSDVTRCDHGYNHESRAIKFLFEVLSSYNLEEQRQFVHFVTGSPRLPVGGFRSLSPLFTVVRKTFEAEENPDNFLPSVMTCLNYLKLPDYTSIEVMRDKLRKAAQEGCQTFHLS